MDDALHLLEAPAAAGRRAQLIAALLLAAVAPMFLLGRPPQTHAVKIELPVLHDRLVPAAAAAGPMVMLSLYLPEPPADPRAWHELEVTPDGRFLVDGAATDLSGLRRQLDLFSVNDQWVDLRPHAEAPYERVLEALLMLRFADVDTYRLDNSAFPEALDEG